MAGAAPLARRLYLALSVMLLQLSAISHGLQVTSGSQCASYCLDSANENPEDPNDSSINSTDIVCRNEDYWSTVKGIKFRACVDCLQSSTAVNGLESDVSWYLCKFICESHLPQNMASIHGSTC